MVLKGTSVVLSFFLVLISNFYSSAGCAGAGCSSGAFASSAGAAVASPSAPAAGASAFASSLGGGVALTPPAVLIGIFSSSVQCSLISTRSRTGI